MHPTEGADPSQTHLSPFSQTKSTKKEEKKTDKAYVVGSEILQNAPSPSDAAPIKHNSYSGVPYSTASLRFSRKKSYYSDGSSQNGPSPANQPFNERIPRLGHLESVEQSPRETLSTTRNAVQPTVQATAEPPKIPTPSHGIENWKTIYKILKDRSDSFPKRKQDYILILNSEGKLQWIKNSFNPPNKAIDDPVIYKQIVQAIIYIIDNQNSLMDQEIWSISMPSFIDLIQRVKPDPINSSVTIEHLLENRIVQLVLEKEPKLREALIRATIRSLQDVMTKEARCMRNFLLSTEDARSTLIKELVQCQQSALPEILLLFSKDSNKEISEKNLNAALELLNMQAVKESCMAEEKIKSFYKVLDKPDDICIHNGSLVVNYQEIFGSYYQYTGNYLADIERLNSLSLRLFIQTYEKLSKERKEPLLQAFDRHEYSHCVSLAFRQINLGISTFKDTFPNVIKELVKRFITVIKSTRPALLKSKEFNQKLEKLSATIKECTTMPIQWEKAASIINELSLYLSYNLN